MIALAENEPFFGETGRDSAAIEASMEREITVFFDQLENT